jgi:hypothetical protein
MSTGGAPRVLRARRPGVRGVCVGLAVTAASCVAPSAAAAPACLQSLRSRYEPGDVVTVLGYGCVDEPSGPGTGGNPVALGYLHAMPADPCADVDPVIECIPAWEISRGPPVDPASGVPLGPVSLHESPHAGRGLRASLTFRIPTDLAPGIYYVTTCGDPCAVPARAYPTWPSPLYVGVDPPAGRGPVHHWPLDDPAIDLLPDAALLLDSDGDEVTAGALRARAAAEIGPSGRVEAAAAPADRGNTLDDHAQLMLWIAAVALVPAAGWLLSRLGASRTRIRPGP